MILYITPKQASDLLTLIDMAVRAQGLQAALVAAPLHDLIQAAHAQQAKDPKNADDDAQQQPA